MTRVSLIIPTNRDLGVLEPCLQSIAAQRFPAGEIELIVVFNGAPVADLQPDRWPMRVVVDGIDAANICAAKNRAFEHARGEWIILLNDDVRLSPGFVQAHLDAHRRLDRPAMVEGLSDWQRYGDETIFDRLVQTTSMVFFYNRMTPHTWYGFRHAWNLNLSLHRRWLESVRFDERLAPVWYDDVEWAFRVERQHGVGVFYEPAALCTHDHRYAFSRYFAREGELGRGAVRLWRANPACFEAIFGRPLDAAAAQYFRGFLEQEGRDESARLERLRSFVEQPFDLAAHSSLLPLLYDAHVPLKRLAFRRALLEALANPESASGKAVRERRPRREFAAATPERGPE